VETREASFKSETIGGSRKALSEALYNQSRLGREAAPNDFAEEYRTAMVVPEWVGLAADVASIAGLTITILVWRQVRSIKRSFVLRARIPEILIALKSINANLLNGFGAPGEPSRDPRADLARLHAVLVNLLQKVERPQRALVKALQDEIREGNRLTALNLPLLQGISRDAIWQVYFGVEGLLESLKQVTKDNKWS
jgi:hypothetical protein